MIDALNRTPYGMRQVIVLPRTTEQTRDNLHQTMDTLTRQGVSIGKEFKNALGFTAAVNAETEKALQASGYRVVDDMFIHLLPARSENVGYFSTPAHHNEGPSEHFGSDKL